MRSKDFRYIHTTRNSPYLLPESIFIIVQSLEWRREERLTPQLDTNPVFPCLELESPTHYFGVSALENCELYSITLMLVTGKPKIFDMLSS